METNEAFASGGTLWFTDLTLKDPQAGLPLLSLAISYIVLNDISKRYPPGTLMHTMLDGFQILKLFMFPFVSQVPSGICLLWISSGTYSLAYFKGLKNSTFRRVLKLPNLDAPLNNLPMKPKNPNI